MLPVAPETNTTDLPQKWGSNTPTTLSKLTERKIVFFAEVSVSLMRNDWEPHLFLGVWPLWEGLFGRFSEAARLLLVLRIL